MNTVVKVENLGKKYIIGHQRRGGRDNFRDVMTHITKSLWQRVRHPLSPNRETTDLEEVWALKDIGFEVKQGERLGIIGRNGAGKSTLLKILSRIIEPTTGSVRIKGRVSSLLEVGTGFHPELTGRENIFLNGAILGMKRQEIKAKFDEIVAFTEIEKYLDTPVKRYSSGMYVRLAFAVAAHLEPEILIVDEVLAVGDAQFQKKCLGKMENVAKEGRTVLFVSHNMAAINNLCQKCILLEKGSVIINDLTEKVVNHYIDYEKNINTHYTSLGTHKKPYIKDINIIQNNNGAFDIDKPIRIVFNIETYNQNNLVISIFIRNRFGITVHHSSDEFSKEKSNINASIRICEIPPYALSEGKYYVDVSMGIRNYEIFQKIPDALTFDVKFIGDVSSRTSGDQWKGICGPGLLKWQRK